MPVDAVMHRTYAKNRMYRNGMYRNRNPDGASSRTLTVYTSVKIPFVLSKSTVSVSPEANVIDDP